MTYKSPLIWVGGKFFQRQKIVNLFPLHNLYCEVFGGAGHILFAKTPAKVEIYNDINGNLVNFFMVARDRTEELIERLDSLPYARSLYQRWKNEPLPDDSIERAVRWFYILHSSFAGVYGTGWAFGKTDSLAQKFRSNIDKIKAVRERLKNVQIDNLDFRVCIPRYDTENTLFYIDPPYDGQKSKKDYYNNKHTPIDSFTEQDHRELADLLNNIKGKAIISYYPTELINGLYPNDRWNRIHYTLALASQKSANKERSNEMLLLNYKQEQTRLL